MKKTTKMFWNAGARLYNDECTYYASALSFTTLLSIVPALSVVVSFLSVLPVFNNFTLLAQKYIFENFLPTSGNVIETYLLAFRDQATHLPTLGLLFLFVTVIALLMTVENISNAIWHAPKRKSIFSQAGLYLFILLCMPVLIGCSVFISTYIISIAWIAGTTDRLGLKLPLLSSLPLLINTLIFATLYIAVPNAKVRWRHGFFGGFLAAILFEIIKKGFAYYLKHFPSYSLIYGTMATIPIFLLWIYLSWLIVLYGALVTHGLSAKKH